MNLRELIEKYITEKVKGQDEKEQVKNLLLVDLGNYLVDEEGQILLPYDISIESLKAREEYRFELADALWKLFIHTTKSKEYTQRRIVAFAEYLKKSYRIELVLNEIFKREAINPYERLVDLLKTLNEGKTKQELMEHYGISRKPLEKDITELVNGTKILGQEVYIRDVQRVRTNDEDREKYGMTYQSTIHPVFLPLNLTEVYYLIMGLKSLSKEQGGIASETYDHLANRIYCQLSEYGRKKIEKKGRETGVVFPPEEKFDKYNGSLDEEDMARENIRNTLMYLWKAGEKCTIHLNNEDMEVINDCYIHYDMDTKEIFIKGSLHGKKGRELDISEILKIDFKYK